MGIRRIILAAAITASMFVAAAAVQAEDEDTGSSVYLVFDPETGDFVTSQPGHTLPDQTGLEKQSAENMAAEQPATSADGSDNAAGSGAAGNGLTPIVMLTAVLVLIVGGVIFVKRRVTSA